ncbi:hypothetical protein FB446DRAFT_729596 [Lentinula raphanica]|nr:hypothetical protein FB446DRAFT_729596 [Lentinula raphanica]
MTVFCSVLAIINSLGLARRVVDLCSSFMIPTSSHERAAPSRSSYVTADENPTFSVSTEEYDDQCENFQAQDTGSEELLPTPQDHDTEAINSFHLCSESLAWLSRSPQGDTVLEDPTGLGDASHLSSSSEFISPISLQQEFEQPMQVPMPLQLIDYSCGLSFGFVPENDDAFIPNPFTLDYEHEHDKTSESLDMPMTNLDSATPTNANFCDPTASEDLNLSLSVERGMSRTNRIQLSLDILRAGRISPVEFLTEMLDVTNPRSAQYRGKLYSRNNKRLDDLLDKIVEDPMGEVMVQDWFRRHSSRKRSFASSTAGGKENVLPQTGSQYYHR